jgi:hypothetical protein
MIKSPFSMKGGFMAERHTGEWTDTMVDRILNRMKVTAIIPDALVTDVQRLARRKNLTESIVFALREWADLQRIRELNRKIEERPMRFREGFSAVSTREASRARERA